MLNPKNDPMGHAITDYYSSGKADRLLVSSDISETDEIPVPWLFRDFEQMPVIEQRAIELCLGHVLDVGSGAGAHSHALLNKGIRTSSIDISELSVKTMKKRGISDVKCIDFYKLPPFQKYDTLLFLMNGAGIAGTLDGLIKFFQKCRQLLNPNGQILLDSSDIKYMYDTPNEMPEYYYGEVLYRMIYKNIFSNSFNWLFIDFENLSKAAEKQGFICSRVADGPDSGEYLAKLTLI